jgi:hypothetical protein
MNREWSVKKMRKRSRSAHEKQMRFFLYGGGVFLVGILVLFLWLINQGPGGPP